MYTWRGKGYLCHSGTNPKNNFSKDREYRIMAGLKEFKNKANKLDMANNPNRDGYLVLTDILSEMDEKYNMELSDKAFNIICQYAFKNRNIDTNHMMKLIQTHTTGAGK